MGEKDSRGKIIGHGSLYYLWYPGTDGVNSGYGLTLYPDRADQLAGLLIVDLPQRILEEVQKDSEPTKKE